MNACLCCQSLTSNPKFCSRSCAAKFNNSSSPKRIRSNTCKKCFTQILSDRSYCSDCFNSSSIGGKGKDLIGKFVLTNLASTMSRNGLPTNRFRAIRDQARRKLMQSQIQKVCRNCGYDKHVECCHIKPISKFPPTTLVSEVNSLTNLMWLCPNCHWEFDSGLLGF